MKKILLLLFTVPLILSCSSDDDIEGGRGGFKLKSERTIADYINEDGNRVNYEYYDEYFYGSNGFVEKIRNVKIYEDEITETYEYLFYEGDKVVRRKYTNFDMADVEVDEIYIYKDNLIVETLFEYSKKGNIKLHYYDSFKNLIRTEYNYNEESGFGSITEYEYKDGNVLTKKLTTLTYFEYIYEYNYEYDNKHIPTKNSFPDAFKKIMYQSKNNITKFEVKDEGFNIEHKYEYNSKGFPVKETYNDGNVTVLYEYY